MCMIRSGKSEDTTMGVSPLDGLPGGTRTGAIDPTLIFHHTPSAGDIVDYKGVRITRAETVLNTEGGLQALCGTSDFGVIISKLPKDFVPFSQSVDTESDPYQLAYSVFLDRLLNYLGGYILKLRGSTTAPNHIDGIVFSGGIGERAVRYRADVAKYLHWLGGEIDEAANGGVDKTEDVVVKISSSKSAIPLFVCRTDEEDQCARMAQPFLKDM